MDGPALALTPPPAHRAGVQPPAATARARLMPAGALLNVMAVSAVVAVAVSIWVLVGLGGWSYYATPQAVRAYSPAHRLLRPSGPVGQTLGVVGAALLLMPFAYMATKRLRLTKTGTNLKRLLEVHIFCGIVGPVLVTYHTAFKFNGIVSAAYWSMALVALSGFAGRYLYVRIPRTIRGVELSQAELDERMSALRDELQWTGGPEVVTTLDRLEAAIAARPPSWFAVRSERAVHRAIDDVLSRADPAAGRHLTAGLRDALVERVRLQQRRQSLAATRRLFDLWHVFHLPLVWVMVAIVSLHVTVALYLGYVPFRW